jgi:DNA helicase-2/ATP-dependent DNA helicase PcrA
VGTFQTASFARVLARRGAQASEYHQRTFTILRHLNDRSRIRLIKSAILKRNRQLDDKLYKPTQVHRRISIAKNNLIGPQDYLRNDELMAQDAAAPRTDGRALRAYAERCFRAGRWTSTTCSSTRPCSSATIRRRC